MIKPATGKWPRVQFQISCRTCDAKITFSIYYGESTVWSNQGGGGSLAAWASHDGHDYDLEYTFYDGREMSATGDKR